MTTFYLIRHGEPIWDLAAGGSLKGAERGWAAHIIPLTDKGISQIENASKSLSTEGPQIVISSPMSRALQSAAILSRILDLPLRVEFDLHEWICGWRDSMELVGETEAEMRELGGEWPIGETRDWEPMSSVHGRVSRVLERYQTFQRVVVVCHEMVIFSLTGKKMGYAEFVKIDMRTVNGS